MVTVERGSEAQVMETQVMETQVMETVVRELSQSAQTGYARCGVIYLECAICGSCVGTRDGEGFSGISECICINCREREDRARVASLPAPAGNWHYRVPCAGVRYYGF